MPADWSMGDYVNSEVEIGSLSLLLGAEEVTPIGKASVLVVVYG